jgi:hypothetical protein
VAARLSAWAAARGLRHAEVGPLLEPYTPVLRQGLGAGEGDAPAAPAPCVAAPSGDLLVVATRVAAADRSAAALDALAAVARRLAATPAVTA